MLRFDLLPVRNVLAFGLLMTALNGGALADDGDERQHQAAGAATEATTVRSGKSNSSDRSGPPGTERASNLNLSKSNINRMGQQVEEAAGSTPAPQPSDGGPLKGVPVR